MISPIGLGQESEPTESSVRLFAPGPDDDQCYPQAAVSQTADWQPQGSLRPLLGEIMIRGTGGPTGRFGRRAHPGRPSTLRR